MCSICRQSPCNPRCPNAPDPPAAFYCHDCGEPIYPGDEYVHVDGVEYCYNCIDDYPLCVLVPLLGGEWKKVQEGEAIKCSDCGRELEAGEEYGVVDGSILCEECLDEIPCCDLAGRLNGDWNTASEGDVYDGYDG